MTGLGQSATEVTEAWRRTISARADRARAAIDGWRAVPGSGWSGQPGHGLQVQPDREVRSPGRHHHGPDLRVGADGRHGQGQIGPEGRPHGVALLGPVQPQGGHVAVGLHGEDLGGERFDGRSRWRGHARERRRPGRSSVPAVLRRRRSGARSGQVVWASEARDPGLLPREALILSTFTPETASSLPGLPWLQQRRAAAAEAFSSSVLPTEKDEVWRYSRIDELDLDRFRPSGTARRSPQRSGPVALRPGPRPGRQPRPPLGPDGDHQRRAGHRGLIGR